MIVKQIQKYETTTKSLHNTLVKILQGMLIVDHFCEGLAISTFHGKLRLGYLALALFEASNKR